MQSTERISMEIRGGKRAFLLRMPRQSTKNCPLLIMFHGTGGTAEWAEDETRWSEHADRLGFAVAYPEVLPPNLAKPPKFLTNPPIWHDGSLGDGDVGQQQHDLQFVATMLDLVVDRFAVDSKRIFVTGFSNGAGMTFAVAANLADRLAGIAPVAGHCWLDNPKPVRPVPTLVMVGSHDPLVPLQGGLVHTPWGTRRVKPSVDETVQKWAHANDCAEIPETATDAAGVRTQSFAGKDAKTLVTSTIIDGLGHHWPGGKGKLSERIGGPSVSTVDACERIAAFFELSK